MRIETNYQAAIYYERDKVLPCAKVFAFDVQIFIVFTNPVSRNEGQYDLFRC